MTRETKLGLGVGVSFLSLVVVVGYNALTRTEEPPAPKDVPLVVVQGKGKPEGQKELSQAPAQFPGFKPAAYHDGAQEPQIPKQAELGTKLPHGSNQGSDVVLPQTGLPGSNPGMPGVSPPFEVPGVPQQNTGVPGAHNPNAPNLNPTNPLPPIPGVVAVKPAELNAGGLADLTMPGQTPPKSYVPEPPQPFGPGAGLPGPSANKGADPIMPPLPSVANTVAKDLRDPTKVEPQAPGNMLPPGFGSPPVPPGQTFPMPGENSVPPPANPFQKDSDAGFKGQDVKNFGIVPGPDRAPKGEAAPLPPFGTPGNATSAPIPVSPGPQAPPVGFGNETPKLAPFVAGANPNKPQVKVHDDGLHTIKPGETDFAAVSNSVYGTGKYAKALQDYNLEYNRDVVGTQGVAGAAQLQPGTKVLIPPMDVLEESSAKSSNQIGMQPGPMQPGPMQPAPGLGQTYEPLAPNPVPVVPGAPQPKAFVTPLPSTGSPIPPPSNLGNPPPFQPVQQAPQPVQPGLSPFGPPPNVGQPPAVTNPNLPGAGQFKLYTVPQGGSRFFEIARDTLGKAERWSEIYSLNTQFDPQFPVPAGTQLKLPADARIGP